MSDLKPCPFCGSDHLVMSECPDDPEADVKAIMERIEKLTKEEG